MALVGLDGGHALAQREFAVYAEVAGDLRVVPQADQVGDVPDVWPRQRQARGLNRIDANSVASGPPGDSRDATVRCFRIRNQAPIDQEESTSAHMKIGIAGINVGNYAVPETGRLAEYSRS